MRTPCPTRNVPPNWNPKTVLAGVFWPPFTVNSINPRTRVQHPPSYGRLMRPQQDVDPLFSRRYSKLMKSTHLLSLPILPLLTLLSPVQAEPCQKHCNECCPTNAPCCPTPNCTKLCSDCCKADDACCSSKKSKCSSSSVPLERGGKKTSPFADKGTPRRY